VGQQEKTLILPGGEVMYFSDQRWRSAALEFKPVARWTAWPLDYFLLARRFHNYFPISRLSCFLASTKLIRKPLLRLFITMNKNLRAMFTMRQSILLSPTKRAGELPGGGASASKTFG
jgi:hypothetical protein